MWPDLMGPGWGPQLLMTVGLMCGVLAAVTLLAVAACRQRREAPDRFLLLWRRYEQGDLTRQEFERLRRSARARMQQRDVHAAPGLRAVLSDQPSSATNS